MENCQSINNKFLLFNNVLLHVIILFIIISLLFKHIITKITVKEINHQLLFYVVFLRNKV